jgi:hypothetical protein
MARRLIFAVLFGTALLALTITYFEAPKLRIAVTESASGRRHIAEPMVSVRYPPPQPLPPALVHLQSPIRPSVISMERSAHAADDAAQAAAGLVTTN